MKLILSTKARIDYYKIMAGLGVCAGKETGFLKIKSVRRILNPLRGIRKVIVYLFAYNYREEEEHATGKGLSPYLDGQL